MIKSQKSQKSHFQKKVFLDIFFYASFGVDIHPLSLSAEKGFMKIRDIRDYCDKLSNHIINGYTNRPKNV